MGDYMRALQQRFDNQQQERLDVINKELSSAIEELRSKLERPERKILLCLIDTAEALRDEQALVSFTAGFKLAHGIAEELGPRYSFAKEEEERACRRTQGQGENDSSDATPIQRKAFREVK